MSKKITENFSFSDLVYTIFELETMGILNKETLKKIIKSIEEELIQNSDKYFTNKDLENIKEEYFVDTTNIEKMLKQLQEEVFNNDEYIYLVDLIDFLNKDIINQKIIEIFNKCFNKC